MRNPIALLLSIIALAGPLAAQPTILRLHPDVPAAIDVAGLHLVLNEEAQRLVQQKADGLCRHQPSFQARVDLADAAFPIIDRVLKQEGVPLDFRYLSLQESALVGDAQSVHEAVGYWQLKRETATGLGLVVSDEVDERKHLTSSTRAAARYLIRSNAALHNWLNALLSYNTGLGGVKPYTLPTDADATEMAITEATSPYVLMFLAQKIAFEPACGLNPKPALRLQEFPAVAGQSLEAQALILHVEPAMLAVHNRWLLAAAVPADRPYTLIVPVGDVTQAAGIVANQRIQSRKELLNMPTVAANSAEVRLNNLRALIALPGETTLDLARRGNQRLGEFLHHNEMTAFDVAVTGRPYYLESKRDLAAVEYHVLQPGETIFDVAQKYGVRQKAIYAKNRLARTDELRPGRVLWLQHVRPREVAPEYRSLPEGLALERPTSAASATSNDVLIEQLNEAATAHSNSQEVVKVKIKIKNGTSATKRVVTEDRDGWGEALSTATAAAAPVRVPAPARPIVSAPEATPMQLPPPAAAPAPAPLVDELRQPDSTAAALAARRSAVVPAPQPSPAPMPAKTVPAAPHTIAAPKPLAMSTPAAAVVTKPMVSAVRPAAGETTHRVEPRENIYSIGRFYNISPAKLMNLNNLTLSSRLVVGQVLVLNVPESPLAAPVAKLAPMPASAPNAQLAGRGNPALYVPRKAAPAMAPAAPAATPGTATQHTVAKGETLYSIARRYKVTVADLQAWNAKPDPSVKVGEVLRLGANSK